MKQKRLHPFFIEEVKDCCKVSEVMAELSALLPGFIEVTKDDKSFKAYIHDPCFEYPSGYSNPMIDSRDCLFGYFRHALDFVDERLSMTWVEGTCTGNCIKLVMITGMSFYDSVLYLATKYGLIPTYLE